MEPNLCLYDPAGVMLASEWDYTTAELTDVALAGVGTYTLLAMDHPDKDTGEITVHIFNTAAPLPENPLEIETFALYANHPNPLNPATTIRFDLPAELQVKLVISTIEGKPVTVLTDERLRSGCHAVSWNGKDAAGRQVASGSYLFCPEAGPYRDVRRMALVKRHL